MKKFDSLFFILFFILFSTAFAQQITITPSTTSTLKSGDIISYFVVATNNTNSKISSVVISDPIPGLPFLFVPNSLQVSGTSLTCSVPTTITEAILISGFDLLPNESISFEFKMLIPEIYPSPGTGVITHTATFSSSSATVSNNISAIPAFNFTKSASPDATKTLKPSDIITYTISFINNGTSTAQNVFLQDKLDTNDVKIISVNNVQVTQDYAGSYTVQKGNNLNDDSIVVSFGNIPVGGISTVVFTVRVKSTATAPVSNFATLKGANFSTQNSNTITHASVSSSLSCTNRNIFYLSYRGNDASAEINNPSKPWQSFKTIIDLINAQGGYAIIRFLDAYYPTSVSGTTAPTLSTPCVTIDGNWCIFDRNSGASVGFLNVTGNNDTIKNLRLTNFNKSPDCSFNITGTSIASPITGFYMEDVRVFATQAVKATTFTNVQNALIKNCEWSNNPFGALDITDSKIVFNDCDFKCNTRGGFGGAITTAVGSTTNYTYTELTFNRGEFSGNSGTGGGADGGAINMGLGTLTINGTKFICNTTSTGATGGGGAIRLQSNSGGSLRPIANISNAVFYNNTSTNSSYGGAINSSTTGTITINKCIFTNNSSSRGGTLYIRSTGSYTIDSSLIVNNTSSGAGGGGIYNNGVTSLVIRQSTISANVATGTGRGVFGAINNLVNSIICDHASSNLSQNPTASTNSLFSTGTVACSTAPAGAGALITAGSYACLAACPTTPTASTNCISFYDIGNVSLSGCKFLNTYTGNFANNSPVILQPSQTIIANVSNFYYVKSPSNTYSWRWLIVNSNDSIVQVALPNNDTTGVTNTTITVAVSYMRPGTYRVYGYYYNKNSANAPTVGTTLSQLAQIVCGTISKTFGSFEILTPIVETVTATCSANSLNACKDRYISKVTVTGGYPTYAAAHGQYTPYYTLGLDPNYIPTTFNNTATSWLAYNTTNTYINSYVAGKSFAVKTTNDRNCNAYPYALDLAAYATPYSCQIAINGNTYHDANGTTDNAINGTLYGTPADSNLYAYLFYVTASGDSILLALDTVSSAGVFSFGEGFAPNRTYYVAFSATPLAGAVIGNNLPSLRLPENWVNTGDGYNITIDANTNQNTLITVDSTTFNVIKFGFEQRPFAHDDTDMVQTNPGSTIFVPVDGALFNKIDSDGTVTKLKITDFPTYSDALMVGDTAYFSTSLPATCPTMFCKVFPATGVDIGVDALGDLTDRVWIDPQDSIIAVQLKFSVTDNASYSSLRLGNVFVPFDSSFSLPITWLSIYGKTNENHNEIYWTTTSEINCKEFEIEKSEDGIHFNKIGVLPAKGNTFGKNEYQYFDFAITANPVYYYRIKSIETTAKISYSRIISLKNEFAFSFNITPNPAANLLVISCYNTQANDYTISIIDKNGKIVLQQKNELAIGLNIVQLNISALAAGTYIVNIGNGSFSKSEKLNVVK